MEYNFERIDSNYTRQRGRFVRVNTFTYQGGERYYLYFSKEVIGDMQLLGDRYEILYDKENKALMFSISEKGYVIPNGKQSSMSGGVLLEKGIYRFREKIGANGLVFVKE